MDPYADLLRLSAAPPADEVAREVSSFVQREPALLARSPLDATVPWLLWDRPVPSLIAEVVASGEDARALAAGAPPAVPWPDDRAGWIETARWAAREAHRALPGVTGPTDLAESLWRGTGFALVEAEARLAAVVPAARLLRWIAVLGIARGERTLFDDACTRVGGLGTLFAEARFHLLVARRIAT